MNDTDVDREEDHLVPVRIGLGTAVFNVWWVHILHKFGFSMQVELVCSEAEKIEMEDGEEVGREEVGGRTRRCGDTIVAVKKLMWRRGPEKAQLGTEIYRRCDFLSPSSPCTPSSPPPITPPLLPVDGTEHDLHISSQNRVLTSARSAVMGLVCRRILGPQTRCWILAGSVLGCPQGFVYAYVCRSHLLSLSKRCTLSMCTIPTVSASAPVS